MRAVVTAVLLAGLGGGWCPGAGGEPLAATVRSPRLDARPDSASDRFEYALLTRGARSSLALSRPAAQGVSERLETEVRTTGHELFWFSNGAHGYLIRDPAWVAKAVDIVEPMQTLVAEQGRLGAIQDRLGVRQGQLGRVQGHIATDESRLAARSPDLDANARAARASMRRELQELTERAREIRVDQRLLDAQQIDLRRRQADLGLRRTRASQRAMLELRALAFDAISSGKARALPD
jgi:hypothetical protein